LSQTEDVVQDVVLHAVESLKTFQPQFDGALRYYLRRGVLNRIKDEQTRVVVRPKREQISDEERDVAPSPFQLAVGTELQERYEAALASLKPEDRELIVARVEFSCSYAEIARDCGKPSVDAARVAVARALVRLAQEMGHGS
jgi:RNA polymerase sigma factor (sigma-70 family)